VNLALTVLEITAPVFLLAAVGALWVRLGFEYRVAFVTRLAMTLAVPCLIFTALMQTTVPVSALGDLLLATILAYGLVTLGAWVLVRGARLNQRTYLAPLIFGNTGNLGLPLALFAFGDLGLQYAVVVFAVMAVYSFTFGVWLVAESSNPLLIVKEPIVGATLLGALFLWQGWQTPVFLTNTMELIGQMAIPMMLITLGVAVGRLSPKGLGRAAWLSLAKAGLCAGIAFAVGAWIGLDRAALGVLVVQIATPVAVTNYLLAEKYGADAQSVAALVVVSTLMSVLLLPVLLAVVL